MAEVLMVARFVGSGFLIYKFTVKALLKLLVKMVFLIRLLK